MSEGSRAGSDRGEGKETMDEELGILGNTEREYVRAQTVDMAELKFFQGQIPNIEMFSGEPSEPVAVFKKKFDQLFSRVRNVPDYWLITLIQCRLGGNAANWALENTDTHGVQQTLDEFWNLLLGEYPSMRECGLENY